MPRPLADDAGFFYVIQLDPLDNPATVKVGWSNNVERRLEEHRRERKRPGAVVLRSWPTRFCWEAPIIRHIGQCGFRRLRGEEYLADNPAALFTAVDAFLEGKECVPSPIPPLRKPPYRVERAPGGMSIEEAADALKVSRGMIYRMVRDGRLKALTIDYRKRGRYLVLRDSLNTLLAGQPPAG